MVAVTSCTGRLRPEEQPDRRVASAITPRIRIVSLLVDSAGLTPVSIAHYASAMAPAVGDYRGGDQRSRVTCWVGNVPVGGGHPVVVQSMTNTDTADPAATAVQVRELA